MFYITYLSDYSVCMLMLVDSGDTSRTRAGWRPARYLAAWGAAGDFGHAKIRSGHDRMPGTGTAGGFVRVAVPRIPAAKPAPPGPQLPTGPTRPQPAPAR